MTNEDYNQAQTPMSDHITRFWEYLKNNEVRITVDMKRVVGYDAPDGPGQKNHEGGG